MRIDTHINNVLSYSGLFSLLTVSDKNAKFYIQDHFSIVHIRRQLQSVQNIRSKKLQDIDIAKGTVTLSW